MSRALYGRTIHYEEFVQRVRRHRPSELLPLVSWCATQLIRDQHGHQLPDRRLTTVHDFVLAGVARTSLLAGNEHRPTGVSIQDLLEMSAAYMAVDPGIRTNEPILPFLVRTAYEQFPFQQGPFWELGRSYALFSEAASDYGSDVITPQFWETALGAPLKDFMSVGFLLHAGALQNEGYYNPAWLDQPNFAPILQQVSRQHIEETTRRQFFASGDELRAIAAAHTEPPGDLRRYSFNPLLARPFLEMPDGRYLAPQPTYTLMRIGPSGLYYIGAGHAGNEFTNELGHVFEHYVGMQLGLLPAKLHKEIVYDPDGKKKTVDWIVEFDDLLLLVEAKAALRG